MAKEKAVEYPKSLYDKAGNCKVVADAAEEKQLGSGWSDKPPKG